MKYTVVSRGDALSEHIKEEIIERCPYDRDDLNPDLIFTVGGDGTILRAIHRYMDRIEERTILGINSGNLGFYANFRIEEIDKAFEILEKGDYNIESYHMLEYDIASSNHHVKGHAMNEITLVNPPHLQVIDVLIDDKHFETVRGTGLCIATPNGSTAYNKSLGGAIIDPLLPSLQLTEIASINSNVYRSVASPLVFCSSRKISLMKKKPSAIMITADQLNFTVDNFVSITCKLSEKKVHFIMNERYAFWERVKKTFI